jgi:hypothetical protein
MLMLAGRYWFGSNWRNSLPAQVVLAGLFDFGLPILDWGKCHE